MKEIRYIRESLEAVMRECGEAFASLAELEAKVEDMEEAAKAEAEAEADTQERIDADARKDGYNYWGCADTPCADCPAIVDGEKPRKRYGTTFCETAQHLDLLRRQRELDAKEGR